MKEEITAFITTYALSEGILEVKGVVCHNISSDMLWYRLPKAMFDSYAHGKNWHRTKEAALARAEEMRQRKIASLKKQIEKLENMVFEI